MPVIVREKDAIRFYLERNEEALFSTKAFVTFRKRKDKDAFLDSCLVIFLNRNNKYLKEVDEDFLKYIIGKIFGGYIQSESFLFNLKGASSKYVLPELIVNIFKTLSFIDTRFTFLETKEFFKALKEAIYFLFYDYDFLDEQEELKSLGYLSNFIVKSSLAEKIVYEIVFGNTIMDVWFLNAIAPIAKDKEHFAKLVFSLYNRGIIFKEKFATYPVCKKFYKQLEIHHPEIYAEIQADKLINNV